MDKVFDPKTQEHRLYQQWEEAGLFKPQGEGPAFSMVIPPPNVTGILHMGHALNMTLQDVVARYYRMKGYRVLWIPGTDHAGIATQNVVEKRLAKEGQNRHALGREPFLSKIWEWKNEYHARITGQIRRLGASVDWSSERFTMDEGLAKAVNTHFVRLHKQGLIYRGFYIINWCPRCETALSDVEVSHKETVGHLWYIRYPSKTGGDGIVVATTRPETMFGDVAIAVHPEDSRYRNLIGQEVVIPLTDRAIPILADSQIDPKFGTGAVKITPAHDVNDFETGKRHALDSILIMTPKGVMQSPTPPFFIGLDRFDCRSQLLAKLKEAQLLIQDQEHPMSIGHCYRCDTIVEPYLSKQWFIKMKDLAKPAIQAVRSKQIQLIPDRWEKVYFDWMEGIRDWCISRQIWWGHQLPVWFCSCSPEDPIVQESAPQSCPKCQNTSLVQDPDVLDTWFSSALWPFSTLGWPEKTEAFKTYYPTTTLITGYDIITFWVSRMITMGLYHTDQIPFKTVYIHGLVRDISGKKMSKSGGNALDPLELADDFGSDALRFSLASLTTLGGQDIKFSREKTESSRNFANKLWNAARYISMVYHSSEESATDVLDDTSANDWIISALNSTILDASNALESYNFSGFCETLWSFTWNMFCDWYIEMSKLNKKATKPILLEGILTILTLLHPIMPFVTESIYHHFRATMTDLESAPSFLGQRPWPTPKPSLINPDLEQQMSVLTSVIREIRYLRAYIQIPLSKHCPLWLVIPSEKTTLFFQKMEPYLKKLGKVDAVSFHTTAAKKVTDVCRSSVGDIQIFIPLAGLIDLDQERLRLKKKLGSLVEKCLQLQKKLSNSTFVEKAPPEVIQSVRSDMDVYSAEKTFLEQQLAIL